MAKKSIPGMETGGGVMSKVVGTAEVPTILVIVIKPEDAPCRENETNDRGRVEIVIPITRNRPSTLRGAIK